MKYSICAACIIMFVVSCKEKPASGPVMNRQFTLPTGSPVTTPANPVVPGTAPIVAANSPGKLNPPHGQPGHRCDIAVGAPLPATGNAAPTLNTTTIQPTSVAAINSASGAPANGLNPAHGQPGHRCDIAVGAPLNSKPTSTSAPSVTSAPKPVTLPPDTLFAKGLNPAHGQPGHRCDIAVGKPLNEPKKVDTAAAIPIQAAGN